MVIDYDKSGMVWNIILEMRCRKDCVHGYFSQLAPSDGEGRLLSATATSRDFSRAGIPSKKLENDRCWCTEEARQVVVLNYTLFYGDVWLLRCSSFLGCMMVGRDRTRRSLDYV
jgi:hypothetical protein